MWGQLNTPALIFSLLHLGNFAHKDENCGPFLSSAFTKHCMGPNLICRGASNTLHGSTRGWWAAFFVSGVPTLLLAVVNVLARLFNLLRYSRILCNPFAILSQWHLHSSHQRCAIDRSCSLCSWEFLSCFHVYVLWKLRQRGLKAVLLPCATILLLGSARKSLWIVAILPDCIGSLLLNLQRSYKHWVHLVLWWTAQNLLGGSEMLSLSQCHPEDSAV